MIINNLLGKNFNTIAEIAKFRIELKRFLKKKGILYNNEDSTDLLLANAVFNGYLLR